MQILTDLIRKRIIGFTKIILELQFKIRVFGEENIPAGVSGALIIANHSSYLDVFVVGIAFIRNAINIRWVISKANYRIWFLKWFYWVNRVIVVNGTVEKTRKAIKENKWVVIFPEGAARWCGNKNNISANKKSRGAAAIALSTGATIIPVFIKGTDQVLPPDSFKLKPQFTINVTIGKPFSFESVHQEKIEESLLDKTTQEIFDRINALNKKST
ncbi:MAG: lysophospholipid acyltransferase family protein [Candidatus Omnitrophota bacterium]